MPATITFSYGQRGAPKASLGKRADLSELLRSRVPYPKPQILQQPDRCPIVRLYSCVDWAVVFFLYVPENEPAGFSGIAMATVRGSQVVAQLQRDAAGSGIFLGATGQNPAASLP